MPFVNDAEALLGRLPADSVDAIILEFLLERGVGRRNAQSWRRIDERVRQRGFRISKQQFQHGLLAASRAGSLFIGSTNRGYFLIENRDDAVAMQGWYLERIAVEQKHLNQLNRLIAECFGQ
jgi:hypothetical protein